MQLCEDVEKQNAAALQDSRKHHMYEVSRVKLNNERRLVEAQQEHQKVRQYDFLR